jgi:putative multicomponent Na+:H+ antiporter subunit B
MNNPDLVIYIIVGLLPLSAFLLVIQVNPYDALVVRCTMGAIAALVYSILGAGDVGLTEALMGTLLAISLYVIAVRSSLVMRLGVLKEDSSTINDSEKENLFSSLIESFKSIIAKYYLRLELINYNDRDSLENALKAKDVHGILYPDNLEKNSYQTILRIERLYEIFTAQKSNFNSNLTYINYPENQNKK